MQFSELSKTASTRQSKKKTPTHVNSSSALQDMSRLKVKCFIL